MNFFDACLDTLDSFQFAKPLSGKKARELIKKYGKGAVYFKRKKKTNQYGPKGKVLFYANNIFIQRVKKKRKTGGKDSLKGRDKQALLLKSMSTKGE